LLSCAALIASSACDLNNPGDTPPPADIYFPTGLALSTQSVDSAPKYLYLVNSNFDLRFNGGSVQAYDLDALNSEVDACATPGDESCVVPASDVMKDEVFIPSLATSLGFTSDQSRLYVATRTDASLLFIDVDESASGPGIFGCDETSDHHCGDSRKRGNDPNEAPRARLVLPPEPVGLTTIPVTSLSSNGVAASGDGNYVLVAHRGGQASLFFDGGQAGPLLIDIVENLPPEPTGVTFDETTHLAYLTVFARGVTVALVKVLSRLGVVPNDDPLSASIYDAGALDIDGVSLSRDTRALTMDPNAPGQALVVSHDPAALLWVDVAATLDGTAAAGSAPARRTVAVAAGPSRLALGQVGGRSLAAVSCFDSQQIFIIDVDTGGVLTIVHNLNGPFELAIDSFRKRLYVADFRSSVVRVLDLSPVVAEAFGDRTDAPILGTLGVAKVVQELQ
jgi:DNA-binding beta-propeller fold protein YncE